MTDTELREQIEVWCAAAIPRPPATDTAYLALADRIMQLFTQAQTKLLREVLEGKVLVTRSTGDSNFNVDAVPVSVIEQKMKELDR